MVRGWVIAWFLRITCKLHDDSNTDKLLVMNVPSACKACIARLMATESRTVNWHHDDPDEWEVLPDELDQEAANGCAVCEIHKRSLLRNGAQHLVAAPSRELPTRAPVVISHSWIGKSLNPADLTGLFISGQYFDIFTYPGKLTYNGEWSFIFGFNSLRNIIKVYMYLTLCR